MTWTPLPPVSLGQLSKPSHREVPVHKRQFELYLTDKGGALRCGTPRHFHRGHGPDLRSMSITARARVVFSSSTGDVRLRAFQPSLSR